MHDGESSWLTPPVQRIMLIAILGLSLIIGFLTVAQMHRSPFGNFPMIDEKSYVDWGMRIASGDLMGEKAFYQDPLYPYFLGLCFRVSNGSLVFARLIQAILSTVSVFLVFLTARHLFGNLTGVLAALLMALYGPLYFYSAILIKVTLIVFFTALACYLAAVAPNNPRKSCWIVLGMSMGLLTLLRGNFLMLIPFVVAWALVVKPFSGGRERMVRAALSIVGVAMVLAPVTIHNYAAGGEFVLTTSQGGANFYIGNNPSATGAYPALSFVRYDPQYEASDWMAEAERRTGKTLKPAEASRFWFREGLLFLVHHPKAAIRLQFYKARLLFNAYEIPDNYHYDFMRKSFMPALWLGFLSFGMLLGPGLLGMLVSGRRVPGSVFHILFAAIYALSVIAFFVVSRYRMPMVPVLAIFSAWAFLEMVKRVREKALKPAALAASLVAVVTVITFIPTSDLSAFYTDSYKQAGIAYSNRGQFDEAIKCYEKAIMLSPTKPLAHYYMGIALLNKKDPAGALESFREAGRLAADNPLILEQLVIITQRLGDITSSKRYRQRLRDLEKSKTTL